MAAPGACQIGERSAKLPWWRHVHFFHNPNLSPKIETPHDCAKTTQSNRGGIVDMTKHIHQLMTGPGGKPPNICPDLLDMIYHTQKDVLEKDRNNTQDILGGKYGRIEDERWPPNKILHFSTPKAEYISPSVTSLPLLPFDKRKGKSQRLSVLSRRGNQAPYIVSDNAILITLSLQKQNGCICTKWRILSPTLSHIQIYFFAGRQAASKYIERLLRPT